MLVELNFKEEILGESVKKDFADEASAQVMLEELQGIFLSEFLDNPRSNRKNFSLGLDHWYSFSINATMTPAPAKYEVSFEFFDAPFGTGNAILKGKIEAEVPDAVNLAELENLAKEAIEEHIWTLVAAGSKELGYQFPADSDSPYRLQIIDPIRGGLLAESVDSNFNSTLAAQLLNGIWGNAWLVQEGFPPLALSLSSSQGFGSKIRLKANVTPSKGDQIHFEKSLEVISVDPEIHQVILSGNHQVLLESLRSLSFVVPLSSGELMVNYPIHSFSLNDGNTEVILQSRPRSDLHQGEVLISRIFEVVKIQGNEFLILGGEEIKYQDWLRQFILNQFFSHEGTHLFERILLRPKIKGKYKFLGDTDTLVTEDLEDSLLDPHFQEECQCSLDDPYTCMAHVILPFWAGRFTNRDFRKFLEHKIKIEAPAHVFLTICWISPEHMQELERAWKIWQLESLKPEIHPKNLSTALSQLIGILEKVRNVYPSGTLHDCAESDSLADAIILNFSSLGEF